MSKGPGRVMRSIDAAIAAEPKRRFTYDELATIAYGELPSEAVRDPIKAAHSRLVVVRRVVQALVSAKRASLGTDTAHWLRTVRAYDPHPLKVAQVQVPS
jgi:hypothetical protein